MNRILDVTTSLLATVARLGFGEHVGEAGPRPVKTLTLYEYEGCPYCRKVREALTVLDLDVMIYPCPKGGPRYRKEVGERGGKEQFPYLVDPNTGEEMYESDDMTDYLFRQYGTGSRSWMLSLPILTDLSSFAASAFRLAGGTRYRAAKRPEKPLGLYSYEGSPFCRIVRERLSELELPYLLHNVGIHSPRRQEFIDRSGRMMVPYLVDPNTGEEMFESADICAYLDENYLLL